jgi:hypothetical protein
MLSFFPALIRAHRALVLALLSAGCSLAAKQDPGSGPGWLDVTMSQEDGSTCAEALSARSGALVIRRLDERGAASIGAEELLSGRAIQRYLPAGIYSIEWKPNLREREGAAAPLWSVRDPAVVSVWSDQRTDLRVVVPACPLSLAEEPTATPLRPTVE